MWEMGLWRIACLPLFQLHPERIDKYHNNMIEYIITLVRIDFYKMITYLSMLEIGLGIDNIILTMYYQ